MKRHESLCWLRDGHLDDVQVDEQDATVTEVVLKKCHISPEWNWDRWPALRHLDLRGSPLTFDHWARLAAETPGSLQILDLSATRRLCVITVADLNAVRSWQRLWFVCLDNQYDRPSTRDQLRMTHRRRLLM